MYDVHGCIQEVAINSKNLSHAHVQAADILTELYGNLKEDQVLMVQMSSAIWRKVSIIFFDNHQASYISSTVSLHCLPQPGCSHAYRIQSAKQLDCVISCTCRVVTLVARSQCAGTCFASYAWPLVCSAVHLFVGKYSSPCCMYLSWLACNSVGSGASLTLAGLATLAQTEFLTRKFMVLRVSADDDTVSAGKHCGTDVPLGARHRGAAESVGSTGRAAICH